MKKIIFLPLFFGTLMPLSAAPKKTSAQTQDPQSVLEKGKEAFLNYDFDEATELFSQYRQLMEKKKKTVEKDFETLEKQLSIASNAFERVEQIVILDSISVPLEDFYKNYRLSKSSGQLMKSFNPEGKLKIPDGNYIFVNEAGDFVLWNEPDNDGFERIKEGIRLIDGEWQINDIEISEDMDFIYPYMSSDGQTIYFSAAGPDSMGGYDLFVAQRDPLTGEFRQPLNMGMPFNSPYDDLLMAIDEESGIGWWATNRHSEEGYVDIYIYIINEVRKNYPANSDNLVSFARLDNYKLTQDILGEEVELKLPEISKDINVAENARFKIRIGNKEYHNPKEFKNRRTADQVSLYFKKKDQLEQEEKTLENLRKQYHSGKKDLGNEIMELEKKIEKLRKEIKNNRNEIYRLETS